MSRHRVKSLEYDDDFDEEYDEADPEEQEQLEAYTNEVLKELHTGQPPVTASREEVQEALWHYYNDVPKSVNYLRSMIIYTDLVCTPLIRFILLGKKVKETKKETAPATKPKIGGGKSFFIRSTPCVFLHHT
jgi:elongation factor 1 alpha-like protein